MTAPQKTPTFVVRFPRHCLRRRYFLPLFPQALHHRAKATYTAVLCIPRCCLQHSSRPKTVPLPVRCCGFHRYLVPAPHKKFCTPRAWATNKFPHPGGGAPVPGQEGRLCSPTGLRVILLDCHATPAALLPRTHDPWKKISYGKRDTKPTKLHELRAVSLQHVAPACDPPRACTRDSTAVPGRSHIPGNPNGHQRPN